jgi:ribosomal protein S18 acetylase RimI-like enzyme
MKDLNEDEIFRCIRLINANFKTNRFNRYDSVIYYIIGSDIVGFIGISDNYLNQICTNINYRNRGIASKLISRAIEEFGAVPIYLFVDKNKSATEYLVNFYKNCGFIIEYENDVEYKMIYKN